jgi:corrinoid protein of di/trimethylamine methyltransferase
MIDHLPYLPRFDLWYNANSMAGTLPERHKGRDLDEITRAEGWPLHKVVPEYLKVQDPEDNLHRALGLYHLKELPFKFVFAPDVEYEVLREGDMIQVTYHTPVGLIRTTTGYTEEMKKSGASITWIREHAIKGPEDYRILAYIYGNMDFVPDYQPFEQWKASVGEDGVAVTNALGTIAASPFHLIQKDLLGATEFYFHFHDYYREMSELAEALGLCYDKVLRIIADSPADAVCWGANFDDMITYPAYFEKEIKPWLEKAAEAMHARGKLVYGHCDGENLGLMELIRDSGLDVAEAVTPFPMTKVKIEEYYRQWRGKVAILGGIPECLLLEESTTREDFEDYLDHFFKAVAPGDGVIVGIGDTTPAGADFERLVRLGERVEKEGRLPLKAGGFNPLTERKIGPVCGKPESLLDEDQDFEVIRKDVLKGDQQGILEHCRQMLDQGFRAVDILNRGMLAAMEVIGLRFKDGSVFIPEVLLSARAMNEALIVLEPYLTGEKSTSRGKVLIGTVLGDLHDIGKNMVSTMLRGTGFEVIDLGINVKSDEFVKKVAEHSPDILGLSALLTTTMPEMKKVIEGLREAGLRERVKIMVGGAPVNGKFAGDIGADGYARDAGDAVGLAGNLLRA